MNTYIWFPSNEHGLGVVVATGETLKDVLAVPGLDQLPPDCLAYLLTTPPDHVQPCPSMLVAMTGPPAITTIRHDVQ